MMNAVRTTFLLALMTGLFMAVGFFIGGQTGMFIALGIAIVTNALSYWNADKIVLSLQHAVPLARHQAPELFAIVENLAARAGLPMPRVYLIEAQQPNAFATGRNPQNAVVAVSRGLTELLEQREIAAVIAHELGHIRSRDTLTMTITATLAGAISMLAQFGFWFGGRNNNSPLGGIGALLTMLVAPLAAAMVQMAISRTREYEADRDGAEISGDPLALASALAKISAATRQFENPFARRTPGMAHLFIINPLGLRPGDSLFATHPAVENRIAALEDMARQMQNAPEAALAPDGAPGPVPDRHLRPGQQARSGRVPDFGPSRPDAPRGPWG